GDASRGRAASLVEVTWGQKVNDCANLPPAAERHQVTFAYVDAAAKGYYVPWSMRMGAPISFRDLLQTVTVRAMGADQYELALMYDGPGAAETRRPLLRRVDETAIPGGDRSAAQTRALRSFRYGSRSEQYGEPQLLDLGPAEDFPSSLTGSVSRPM